MGEGGRRPGEGPAELHPVPKHHAIGLAVPKYTAASIVITALVSGSCSGSFMKAISGAVMMIAYWVPASGGATTNGVIACRATALSIVSRGTFQLRVRE